MTGVIKLAVMAVGGQGGGVLTAWIEAMARAQGYAVQATSVAGVAQRTGATVYYIEMSPQGLERGARQPVFALMPAAGDVDILIAAEMMEAGRAIIRGFVTPDRTTLIASTHRALAVSEKMMPGDGIASSAEVRAAAEIAARWWIAADFEALAAGSVISAALFGGLAASGALPFPRAAFEAAIVAGGRGVSASMRAFGAGYAAVDSNPQAQAAVPLPVPMPRGPAPLVAGWQASRARAERLPIEVVAMAKAGLQKVVEFQDLAYGRVYLDQLEAVLARDQAGRGYLLTQEVAKHLANAMAYDDVIRVADLKTRAARFQRIRGEMAAGPSQVMQLTEYFHPRAEEIVGMLPAGFGARIEARPRWMARIDRIFGKGRHLRSDGVLAYALLYTIAGLRRWRPRSLRHVTEAAHRKAWLAAALGYLPDYDLAVEVIRCRRLIKGYSDTQARGLSKFDRVMAGIAQLAGRPDAAQWAARLREAALQDEEGIALDGALLTIGSFV